MSWQYDEKLGEAKRVPYIPKSAGAKAETAKQTPGALRAANLVMTLLKWPKTDRDAYRESVAQLIDNETAAPELLEALRDTLEVALNYGIRPNTESSALIRAHNLIKRLGE